MRILRVRGLKLSIATIFEGVCNSRVDWNGCPNFLVEKNLQL